MSKLSWRENLWNEVKQIISITDAIDIEQSAENIRQNVPFRGPNVVVLICAIVIASVGLNVNSIPVIIGAMLISPLMGPIVGLGLGVGTNDVDLLKYSLKHLTIMVVISLIASTLYFLVSPLSLDNPSELLNRTNPTLYDVLIAFFGGAAGILETSRKDKGTTAAGVAIATALMPPLCTVGYGIANLEWNYVIGAAYLFLINSVFIASAALIGVKWMKYPLVKSDNPKRYRRNQHIIAIVVAAVMIPSVYTAVMTIIDNSFNQRINAFIEENRTIGNSYVYKQSVNTKQRKADLFLVGESLNDTERADFFAKAEKSGFKLNQFVLHEEATMATGNLDENKMVQDILTRQDNLMREREQHIDSLQTLLWEYQNKELPTTQLASELKAQIMDVDTVYVLRGQRTVGENMLDNVVWVVVDLKNGQPMVSDTEKQKICSWLKVRLGEENVKLSILQ